MPSACPGWSCTVYIVTSEHVLLERLFALALAVEDVTRRGLEQRNLSRAQARLLWALTQAAPVVQQRLGERLEVTPRYVTRLVDSLSERGLVARSPHPSDRRSLLVALTPAGERLVAQLRSDHDRLASHLFDGLTPDQMSALASGADHVLDRLDGA